MPDMLRDASVNKLRTHIETTYSPIARDEKERLIDSLIGLIEHGNDRKQNVKSLLEQACRIIFKFFDFHEISIGLKSRKDGLFRYEVLFGYRKEVQDDFLKLAYSHEDMTRFDKFPNFQMGRISNFNFVEGLPDKEKYLFALPHQLDTKRDSLDTFHEGDYIDTWIYGPGKELIGWIEMSSPLSKKLPLRENLKWIELIASVLGMAITQKWKEEGPGPK